LIRALSLAVLLAVVPAMAIAGGDRHDGDRPVAEKKICRKSQSTGSIMTRRVCHTRAEWDSLSAKGKSDLDRTRSMERSRSMVGASREN
jgi:hypothetical protein